MDWTEIEKRLCERAEEVCRFLLPKGRRVAHEWCVGSVAGEEGDSCKINLEGKVGVWADFAADKRGKTMMSLWCSVRSQAFRDCIVEAKKFLGIEDGHYERRLKRSAPAPETDKSEWQSVAEIWARCQELTEGGPVWNYVVEERRILPAALEVFEVREMALSGGRWAIVFPYYVPHVREEQSAIERAISERGGATGSMAETPNSKLQTPNSQSPIANSKQGLAGARPSRIPSWLKFEALERVNGKKKEWTTRGPEKCLWGMQAGEHAMFRRADHLLICEGEKDVLSWATYGCGNWGANAVLPVSVPFGAKWRPKGEVRGPGGEMVERSSPNREWLDRCWDWMQGFETVFVGMDMDEAGRKAAADVITEIGPRRCRLVELPGKVNR